MTELELRTYLVNKAKSYLGAVEGSANHKAIIDGYNAHKPLARGYAVKYTDAWCATFVSFIAIKCGLTDIIPKECGCDKQIALFKKLGAWQENDAYVPSPGDVIYYDWDDSGSGDNTGGTEHVGIVVSVSGKTIKVIEGNISNSVGYRTLKVNGRYIRGYGVPKYSTKVTATTDDKINRKSVDEIVTEVLAGKWGNGSTRRDKLTAEGYDYDAIQEAVNARVSGRKTVDQVARDVLLGKYGNGETRKRKIEAEGYDYDEVQARVNKLVKG